MRFITSIYTWLASSGWGVSLPKPHIKRSEIALDLCWGVTPKYSLQIKSSTVIDWVIYKRIVVSM